MRPRAASVPPPSVTPMPRCSPRRRHVAVSSSRAGACGPRASAARRPPTAMPRSDRTTPPAASSAPPSAPTIASRQTPLRALRWPAAAPVSRVANGGSGRSDLFQAGAFVRHTIGAAYISARAGLWLAGRHHRPHRDRRRHRSACAPSSTPTRSPGRSRAAIASSRHGWRHRHHALCRRPVHHLRSAGLCRTARSPAPTPLHSRYSAKSVTAPRSELGLRADKSFAMQDGIFTLRGRAAWAHDYNTDRNVAATFQTLPGAAFVVNGARAGQRRRADHRVRRMQMAERLLARRRPSKASSPTSPAAMPARASRAMSGDPSADVAFWQRGGLQASSPAFTARQPELTGAVAIAPYLSAESDTSN